MDLLEEQYSKKKEKSSAQKIILTLLIISVILLILAGGALFYFLTHKKQPTYEVQLNGENLNATIINVNGVNYIGIRDIADKLEYSYYNGEYEVYNEDKNSCYIDNGINIIGFEADSNKIYKVEKNTDLDYEYYTLNNKIIKDENDKLYIADGEDLRKNF